MKTIAVVTGASSGIGREFAIAIAGGARGVLDEIWLIARGEAQLQALANTLPVFARVIPLDLTVPASLDEYAALLRREQLQVSIIVNAAGFGYFQKAEDTLVARLVSMIDLNDRALTALTMITLPYMDRGSAVIQLGSLSSFQPVPYMCVYGASKAYVVSFSRALNIELKPRGIRVMAVCPGWVRTDFLSKAPADPTAVTYMNKVWDPRDVVIKALTDLKRGKDMSVLGIGVRAQVLAAKLLPHSLVMKIWLRQQKHDAITRAAAN